MTVDEITRQLADLAAAITYADLPDDVVHATRTRIIDALGCAYGGAGGPTATVTQAVLPRFPSGAPGRSTTAGWEFGREAPDLSIDGAAFINTTKIRYLDFNDWYPGGHPSDSIGGLLAFAGFPGVTGQKLVTATVVAYEIFIRITRSSGFRKAGFDQGLAMGVATAAAIGNLLDLDRAAIASAAGIISASGVPTRATRSGTLSMWKGCATAYATRNAAFVALLAAAGMTGPGEAFQGRNGLQDLITGPFDLEPVPPEGPFFLPRTSLKYWPVCYHLQAAAWAGMELRKKVDGRQIDRIDVGTYWEAWRDTGSEPAKWDPTSRETADHSLPYVLARTMEHGGIDEGAFESSAFLDPNLRPVMSRIRVAIDDEVQAAFPESPSIRVTAALTDGSTVGVEVVRPSGHADNPMTEAQVLAKFTGLASEPLGGADRAAEVFAAWWDGLTRDAPLPMAESAAR